MHPYITSALAEQHQRDLSSQARRRQLAASLREPRRRGPHRHGQGWRVPRYRVSWSRTSLSPAGPAVAAGRRERSWVIVISATRAL